jgi:NADPH-dependent glutamate synthase beta subunit-like oxidoreductase
MRGVFAAGDVRHGSVKRVASAVGEGSHRSYADTSTWTNRRRVLRMQRRLIATAHLTRMS